MRHMRGLFTTDDSGEVAVSLVKREKKCWEIHEVVRVAVRSAPSAVVYRVYGGREGGGWGRERDRDRERERERCASALVWIHSTFSSHTVQSRDLLRAGPGGGQSLWRLRSDRASEWKLPGEPLLTAPGACVSCLGHLKKNISPFLFFLPAPVPVLHPHPHPPQHLPKRAISRGRCLLLPLSVNPDSGNVSRSN